MPKRRIEPPTPSFPHAISWRLQTLSKPRKDIFERRLPRTTPQGTRLSALRGTADDRVVDLNYPYTWRLLYLKKAYKDVLPPHVIECIDRCIENSNATCYAKLANCVVDLRSKGKSNMMKKRGWSEGDWKKHMDYIGQIAVPKDSKRREPEPVDRGPSKPLEELDIDRLILVPKHRLPSEQDIWYKDPTLVWVKALRYRISKRIAELAAPRVNVKQLNYLKYLDRFPALHKKPS